MIDTDAYAIGTIFLHMNKRLLISILVGVPMLAHAENLEPCKSAPNRVGVCFDLHGRANLTNGTPSLRIWPIGSHRLLGVPEQSPVPDVLANALTLGNSVFADFEVCPLTKQSKGTMQFVCVSSVKNISVGAFPSH